MILGAAHGSPTGLIHSIRVRQVCVKVQHHGVGSLMKTDLATIEFCARQMLKRHPDAPDFTDALQQLAC